MLVLARGQAPRELWATFNIRPFIPRCRRALSLPFALCQRFQKHSDVGRGCFRTGSCTRLKMIRYSSWRLRTAGANQTTGSTVSPDLPHALERGDGIMFVFRHSLARVSDGDVIPRLPGTQRSVWYAMSFGSAGKAALFQGLTGYPSQLTL